MIDAAGNPRLMDFGLAKQVERDATVTMQKHVLGTPVYMSPEQARGNSQEVDRRTDVYSLGATLYHLLTHQIPFYGEAGMVCDKVLHEQPTRPRMIDRLIPIDLETICLKAMQKEPAQRYQTGRVGRRLGTVAPRQPIVRATLARSSSSALVPPQPCAGWHDCKCGLAPRRRQHRFDDHRVAGGQRTRTRGGKTAASGGRKKGGSGCSRQKRRVVVAPIRRKREPLSPRSCIFG